MATMTLKYDARNPKARNRVEEIRSWGIFSIVEDKSPKPRNECIDGFKRAMQEAKRFKEGKLQFRGIEELLCEL